MRMLIAVCLVLATAFPAGAISRLSSQALSCAAIQQRIASEGAVILRYPGKMNPSLTLYDRYVRDASQCDSKDTIERASVPAADNPLCRVKRCVQDYDRCDEARGRFCGPERRKRG